jgi:cytosine/uracil/thiamine/allantoin permease
MLILATEQRTFTYFGYFWGFSVAGGLYVLLSRVFPAKEAMLHKTPEYVEGTEA